MKTLSTAAAVVFLLLLMQAHAFAQTPAPLLIAVAAQGNEADSAVGQAARSPFFLMFDGQGNLIEAVANPHSGARRQAGVSAAGFLHERKVNVIIAETFGGKMETALQEHRIQPFQHGGNADEGVAAYLRTR